MIVRTSSTCSSCTPIMIVLFPSRRNPPVLASMVAWNCTPVRASINRPPSFSWTTARTSLIGLRPLGGDLPAGEQPSDRPHDLVVHVLDVTLCVDDDESLRRFARQLEKSCPHALVEGQRLLLQTVAACGAGSARGLHARHA